MTNTKTYNILTDKDLSFSITGNADTATKLGTATVGGSNQPIYLNAGTATAVSWYYNSCTINGGNKANYPWHRFATCTTGTGQWVDKTVIIIIHSRFDGGGYGMVKLSLRTNATNAAKSTSAVWIYRKGFAVDDIKISAPTKTTGTDETINAYIKCSTYPRRIAYILEGSNIGWNLVSSNEPNDTTTSDKKGGIEINASVSGNNATDGATVSYANSAGSADTATALGSNAGGTEQPIYFNEGKPAATSYSLKANISNSTAGYMAYYSADRTITGISNIRATSAGSFSVFPVGGSYRDGIRIHARTTDNTWSAVILCGADNTGDTGTSANTWFIGNNNGNLYFGRNGTGSSGTFLRCVDNVWAWNGTASGSISGNAATATTASACSGNAATATSATTCSYPQGFVSRTTSSGWGNTTGTHVTGWSYTGSCEIAFLANNPSSGKLSVKVDGRYYGNEGNYPAMLMRNENSYWGICDPDAANNVWIRTTT
jgi:hypothetical protein